jgi:hypothetical protein
LATRHSRFKQPNNESINLVVVATLPLVGVNSKKLSKELLHLCANVADCSIEAIDLATI